MAITISATTAMDPQKPRSRPSQWVVPNTVIQSSFQFMVFPPLQQLSIVGAVGQTLLPKIGGGRTAVFEIMVVTPAIRSMILQSKTFQIVSAIQTGKRYGMQLLDDALEDLVDRHVISLETALAAANEPDKFKTGRQT